MYCMKEHRKLKAQPQTFSWVQKKQRWWNFPQSVPTYCMYSIQCSSEWAKGDYFALNENLYRHARVNLANIYSKCKPYRC